MGSSADFAPTRADLIQFEDSAFGYFARAVRAQSRWNGERPRGHSRLMSKNANKT